MTVPPAALKILLVEDSPDDVFFFQRTLQKCGVPVTLDIAEDGAKAIQRLAGHGHPLPQLMFLDLKMPNANGFEVLDWLGQQAFKSAIRTLVLTSSDDSREAQLSRSLGAADFITKPVSVDQLRKAIGLVTGESLPVS